MVQKKPYEQLVYYLLEERLIDELMDSPGRDKTNVDWKGHNFTVHGVLQGISWPFARANSKSSS